MVNAKIEQKAKLNKQLTLNNTIQQTKQLKHDTKVIVPNFIKWLLKLINVRGRQKM